MCVAYTQAKDFHLPPERESFLYIKELQGDTPFVWDMYYDVSHLGNLDLLHDLLARYQQQKDLEDIGFRFDMQILENAVKSRNIVFLSSLFRSPFSFPINTRTLPIAAKSGNVELMEKLLKRQDHFRSFEGRSD